MGDRTRDLPACSIVLQPTTLPRAPRNHQVGCVPLVEKHCSRLFSTCLSNKLYFRSISKSTAYTFSEIVIPSAPQGLQWLQTHSVRVICGHRTYKRELSNTTVQFSVATALVAIKWMLSWSLRPLPLSHRDKLISLPLQFLRTSFPVYWPTGALHNLPHCTAWWPTLWTCSYPRASLKQCITSHTAQHDDQPCERVAILELH
jgi:hypothetical protein